MTDILSETIDTLAGQIRAGERTPPDLVEQCLARIAALEPRVQAWRLVDAEGARAAASALAEEARARRFRGPLHGIPVGVKDIIDVEGLPTRAGSPSRQDAPPAAADAPIVARLRAAGAVVLGKTHTTEFAFFDPAPTHNPYRPGHTPGGSSSGSAAAVAARMVPLALGSQTNASVCRPAAYCGVAGFKPTFGSLPTEGVVPLAPTFDTLGLYGLTIADAAAAYLAAAGLRPPASAAAAGPRPERPLRIGVVADPLYDRAAPAVRSFQEAAARRLAAAGHALEPVRPPAPFAGLIEPHGTVMAYEAGAAHGRRIRTDGERIGPKFRELVEQGLRIGADRYEEARRALAAAAARAWEAFRGFDALLVPPVPAPAPAGLRSTGDPTFITPWTVFGGPLAVVPGALDEQGLPLAVMLAAPPGADVALIGAATRVEAAFGRLPEPPTAA